MRDYNGCGRKWSWPYLRHYTGVCLKVLKETELCQDSRFPDRDMNPLPPGYEAGVSNTVSRCSTCLYCCFPFGFTANDGKPTLCVSRLTACFVCDYYMSAFGRNQFTIAPFSSVIVRVCCQQVVTIYGMRHIGL